MGRDRDGDKTTQDYWQNLLAHQWHLARRPCSHTTRSPSALQARTSSSPRYAWRSSRARPSPIAMAAEPSPENIEERIQFLRRRESELKKIIEEEEGATAAPAPQSDIAAQSDITIRLPEGVQPGQRLSATLANGVRVRFIAPENAQPGQILRVKGPANAAIGPAEDQGMMMTRTTTTTTTTTKGMTTAKGMTTDDEYEEIGRGWRGEDGGREACRRGRRRASGGFR